MDDQRTDRESGGMKQFSIRDLLFLVLIIALALGWWLDKRPIPARFTMGGGDSHAYILDTATGQAWEKSYSLTENPQNSTMQSPGYFDPKISIK
jgi:hypothetical protein